MATAGMTNLLQKASSGDKDAEAALFTTVYRELHRIARAHLKGERPEHTLQATALVHEAYLRVFGTQNIDWKCRAQFFGIAGQTMRRILVDHARRRRSDKRNGGQQLSLDEGLMISSEQCDLVADLDELLVRLAESSPRAAKVVELRFFGGLSEEEIADILDVSVRTVKRDWRMARAWLYGELSPHYPPRLSPP